MIEDVKNEVIGLRNSLQTFMIACCGNDKEIRTISIADLEGVLKGYLLYAENILHMIEEYEKHEHKM